MQQRYFIGISLPDELSRSIHEAQMQSVTSSKLMQPIRPHITLLHPGLLSEVSPLYLRPKAAQLASKHMPFNIKLTRLDKFDRRVLFIAVDSPTLHDLHRDLTDLLPDKVKSAYLIGRQFSPHVTLAQAKPMQKLAGDIEKSFQHKLAKLLPAQFEARQIDIFTWQSPRTYISKKFV